MSACGGEDSESSEERRNSAFERSIRAAQRVSKGDFPPASGRTLQQVADGVLAVQAGLATQEFTPGRNRLAFGVIGRDNKLVYGPSAVYLATTPNDRAEGPFPAPADPLVVDPLFRSKQAALESDVVAAIQLLGLVVSAMSQSAPRLERVWRSTRDLGVVVLGLNMQDISGDAREFIDEFGISCPNVRDLEDEVARDWGATGLPETFFIDARGRVVGHVIGAVCFDQLMQGVRGARSGRVVGTQSGGDRRATP